MNNDLHKAIEDIVYAWSMNPSTYERLVDELHDYVIETYGPPF